MENISIANIQDNKAAYLDVRQNQNWPKRENFNLLDLKLGSMKKHKLFDHSVSKTKCYNAETIWIRYNQIQKEINLVTRVGLIALRAQSTTMLGIPRGYWVNMIRKPNKY